MANHSVIPLRKAVTPEDVEHVLEEINQRRFGGRLRLVSTPELTAGWRAEKAWLVEAPGTRPKKPDKFFKPDENLCFCFWLNKGGQSIETRHSVHNSWMYWVMNIHEHELAKAFGLEKFDGGDGDVKTDPDQYGTNFRDHMNAKLPEQTPEDIEYLQKRFFDDIPEGWE